MENWKEYFEYEISDLGRIRNRKTQKVLKPYMKHNGYLAIDLFINKTKFKYRVNRLVAHVWLGYAPEAGYECHHINSNRIDNRVCNLAWVTHKENIMERDKRRAENKASSQLWVHAF